MSAAEDYVRDALTALILELQKASTESAHRKEKDDPDSNYYAGRAMAYYEVVSYLLQQMDAFQLERSDYGVPVAFSPEDHLK